MISELLPINPVGFMLPKTGPGKAASPILKDITNTPSKLHKLYGATIEPPDVWQVDFCMQMA